jgi:hypothetical protein
MNVTRNMGFALCAATLTLAACGAGTSQNDASSVVPSRPASGRVWMDGGTGQQDLLYVSNSNGEVTVYRYWERTLVGVLSGFTKPMGECVDKGGDVFITDYTAQQIVEYAHGGTKPIAKLNDAPDSPYACSVDLTTGNLAVANNDGTSKQGNVAIWQSAEGAPARYTDSKIANFIACAYDGSGNLLVSDGYSYPSSAAFAWLPKGGSNLINVGVPGPEPSYKWGVTGIQWDGKYFVLDNYYLYRISLIHGQAYYVGETEVESGGYGPYWIYNNASGGQGTQVVGGVNSDEGQSVNYWQYPSGGDPLYSITHGIDDPVAVTISLKLKK